MSVRKKSAHFFPYNLTKQRLQHAQKRFGPSEFIARGIGGYGREKLREIKGSPKKIFDQTYYY